MLSDYEIRLPMLAEVPDFFDLTSDPKRLIQELIKLSVFKDGVLVGANVPLDDAVVIAAEITGRLNPK